MFVTSLGHAWKHLPVWQQEWKTVGLHSISGDLFHIIILMFTSGFLKEQLNWKKNYKSTKPVIYAIEFPLSVFWVGHR